MESWRGQRRIVLGIDIGTTQSAVAYAYLYPNGPQLPQRVTRWPGQESQKTETKIPSIVWYDPKNKARAFGAEARLPDTEETAEDEGWELVKFFKLHLHPETMRAQHDIRVEPLPDGLSVEQVYADFLGYLFRHTEAYFKETTIDGPAIWLELQSSMMFVIAHPNGWELKEQGVLQRAAVKAGLIRSVKEADDQIRFVSEAEASVHFVMLNADIKRDFQLDTNFLVCDAGGSTVDTTYYTVDAVDPLLQLKEKRASDCVQAGAIFVDEFAKVHFRDVLSKAGLKSDELNECLTEAITSFENDAKKSFEDASEDKSIKVGPHKMSVASLGIKRGRMALKGQEIETFFLPCVSQIMTSIKDQIQGQKAKYLLLVGGFGDSPYLRKRLREELGPYGIQVILANDSTAKAVSDGAITWFVKQAVIGRVTRFGFGIHKWRFGTAHEASMLNRTLISKVYGDIIRGYWGEIVQKGSLVATSEEKYLDFWLHYTSESKPALTHYSITLYATDSDTTPDFVWNNEEHVLPGFREVCEVSADLSQIEDSIVHLNGPGGWYWEVPFKIAIKFGMTSLEAYLCWKDHGVERRGRAMMIPPDFY